MQTGYSTWNPNVESQFEEALQIVLCHHTDHLAKKDHWKRTRPWLNFQVFENREIQPVWLVWVKN